MREELKKAGWKHVAEGGKDFCPKCKPRRKGTTIASSFDRADECYQVALDRSWLKKD
jgi:hypothetical protein